MTEEQKEKYANFLNKVSEILGLNRPVDILRLCAVTDEYFRPIEKRIEELEEKNAELKEKLGDVQMQKAGEKSNLVWKLKTANEQKAEQLTKAKEIINNCVHELQIILLHKIRNKERIASILDKAEQFLEGE